MLPREADLPKFAILFVDDEEIVRRVAVMALTRDGYTILAAKSGLEALEVASAHPGPIDLVLTDLRMPGMNGLELRERIMAQRPEAFVVVLSGDTYSGGIPDGVQVIQKPFTAPQLRERVRRLLGLA